jgi:hypothetical protein
VTDLSSDFRALGLSLALVLAVAAPLGSHELERTQVTLALARDGMFTLDISNDPSWLLMRLEPFATGRNAPLPSDPNVRDTRLAALGDVFADRVVFFLDGQEVRARSVEYLPPRPQTPADPFPPLATFRLHGRLPPNPRTLRWFYGIVVDPYPLTIRRADGESITEWIGGAAWSTPIDLTDQFTPPTRWEIARQYLVLGYEHILPKGIDHILFVLGLFLLSTRLKPILLQVTTFTLAHSITLGLTMYGIVSLPSRIVEPLIALSIAYVAVENLMTSELKPWRLVLVFSFGLLHGMGFAGVLTELGLPQSDFLIALLTFNLGVEAGQLTVLAIAFVCVAWYRQRSWYRRRVVVPASILIAGIGLYWTVTRAIG